MPPSPPDFHQTPRQLSNAERRRHPTLQVLAPSNWVNPSCAEKGNTMLSCQPRLRSMSKLACSTPVDSYKRQKQQILLGAATEMRVRRRPVEDEMESVREESLNGGDETLYSGAGGRIMVYVRMRPMSKTEKDSGGRCCVRIVNKKDVYLTEFASETDYLRLKRLKGRHFVFDAAFTDIAAQQEVYNISTAELVEGVLQGRNGSVFCYGATGAGKTHTMLGTTQNPGVMVLALRDLFCKLRQRCQDGDYTVRLSYLEVYNESVRDLLSPGRPLVLREDSKQGIVATGLTHYEAYSADEVMALLHQGNQNRTTEPTRANETSSRSHAILQVSVELKHLQETHQYVCRTGKLSLIDLAGSERALATDQRSIRSLEGANINRSLLALSSCINALVEGKKHIPFRNSKLTQLLKDSLGGTCRTSMIANISPSNLTFGETQNTLHWADRAKQIRTKSCSANEEIHAAVAAAATDSTDAADQAKLLLEVQKENQQLRLQLARMQQKLMSMESSAIMVARHSPVASAAITATPQRAMASACRTPNTMEACSKMTATRLGNRHEECRATEELLRRKVQELQQERDEAVRELAEREAQTTSSIAELQRGHNLQLRHKEDVIRTLCNMAQKNLAAAEAASGDGDGGSPVNVDSQRMVAGRSVRRMTTGGGAMAAATTGFLSGSARRMSVGDSMVAQQQQKKPPMATAMASCRKKAEAAGIKSSKDNEGKGAAVAVASQRRQQEQQQERRLSSRIPQAALPKTPTSSNKEAMKKRTFWDITNANSPSAPPSRCTRSNTAAVTPPSMLLQPGFLGGAGRRRLLQ